MNRRNTRQLRVLRRHLAVTAVMFYGACTSETGFLKGTDDTPPLDTDTTPTDSGSAEFDFYREMPPCGPGEVWCPGDPIPGWPTLTPDLTVLDGKPVVEWELGTAFGQVSKGSRCPEGLPDCGFKFGEVFAGPRFVASGEDSPESEPLVDVVLWPSEVDRVLGLGWYQNVCTVANSEAWTYSFYRGDGAAPSYISGGGECPDEVLYVRADTRAFLSDVRPDRIRGLVYFDLTTNPDVEDPMVYLLNFEIRFPLHGGRVSYNTAGAPDFRVSYDYLGYEDGYDNAWPWDYITDPAIRDRVYELYMPYGMVWPEERRRRPE